MVIQMAKGIPFLIKKCDIYYLQKRVPKKLIPSIGQKFVRLSLRTKDKQLRQIKAWYETKKGDGAISAESEEVLKEILNKGKILKKAIDEKVK